MKPLAFDLLEQLEDLCKEHDFAYAYTEDTTHYAVCEKRAKKIRKVVDELAKLGCHKDSLSILSKYAQK